MQQIPSGQTIRTSSTPIHRLERVEPPMFWRRVWHVIGRQEWAPAAFYLLLDVSGWLIICNLVGFLRHDVASASNGTTFETQSFGLGMIIFTLFIIGGYDRRRDMRSLNHTSEHVIAMISAAALASLLIYSVAAFNQNVRPSRGVLLLSFALFTPASLSYRRFLSRALAVNTAKRVFLVLGAGETARRFYATYQRSPNRERLRFVDLRGDAVGQPIAGADSPVVEGDPMALLDGLGANSGGVILAEDTRHLGTAVLDRLVRMHFQKAPVYTLESFYETHWRRIPIHHLDATWPLQTGFQLRPDSPYYQAKRIFDVCASSIALLLLSPLLCLLLLWTWLDSGRPALFRQIRVGRGQRAFTIYKFRTMFMPPPADASQTSAGPENLYTSANDPRITRLGRWLRKLRLDELPQLWNVFRGDMSLIGPRAEWIKCVEHYENSIPCYHFRHLVKPGITGWAQVNYPYGENEEDAVQKLKYDLYYIRHYSLRLDAMIILKTLHIIFWGKGQ